MFDKKVALFGSDRRILPGAKAVGDVDRNKLITVSVYVRLNPDAVPLPSLEERSSMLPGQRRMPSDAAFAAARNANPKDIAVVEQFGAYAGLTIVESSLAKRSVRLQGTIDELCKAFDTDVRRYSHRLGDYRGRVGPVHIPLSCAASSAASLVSTIGESGDHIASVIRPDRQLPVSAACGGTCRTNWRRCTTSRPR